MKFTTNLERYFFAKVCKKNASERYKFSLQKKAQYPKGSEEYKFWDKDFEQNLSKFSFWAKVAEYFEHAAFEGISEGLKRGLARNGIHPMEEA